AKACRTSRWTMRTGRTTSRPIASRPGDPLGSILLARIEEDVRADNLATRGLDRSKVILANHICRGNGRSAWHTSGGYEPIAEMVFGGLDVDRLLLEYDSDRAGGFEPLRFVPRGRQVVLGLVTTKVG